MYVNTQKLMGLVNFDILFKNYIHKPLKTIDFDMDLRLLILIGLVTGSKFSSIITLRWKDILYFDSQDGPLVKVELISRKYPILIHPIVKSKILETYIKLDYPNLDSIIIQSLSSITLNSQIRINSKIKSHIVYYSDLSSENYEIYKRIDFNFVDLTQILFGRKVFEVNGYSNTICKKLKQHFGFRLNKELFKFLGFSSKEEIKYEISEINLDCNNRLVVLKDKNFNDNYSFQQFLVFSKFLFSKKHNRNSSVTDSIILLLLMSLYNGIRPSTLIHLKWEDLIYFNDKIEKIDVEKSIFFKGYKIHISKEICKMLINHFEHYKRNNENELLDISMNVYVPKIINPPKLNDSVFIMNNGNPITQPSLSREIKKTLFELKFPHTDKINSKSTLIMYGRRIIEIKGDHKPTINKLKEHFNFRSKKQLFDFLSIDYNVAKDTYQFKGKVRNPLFEEILFDL